MFKRRSNRVKPLLPISSSWKSGDKYPDVLNVAMQNGRVVRYIRDCRTTRLHLGNDGWEKTGNQIVGYEKDAHDDQSRTAVVPERNNNNDTKIIF